MHFITRLLYSNSYNVLLMVIDRLTKEKYYIPYIIDENGTTAKAIAY